MKISILIVLAALSLNVFAYQGYDNTLGREATQCIRNQIAKAPALDRKVLDKTLDGTKWHCNELMYLWDENKNFAIFVHDEGARFGEKFAFRFKTDHHGTNLVEYKFHQDRYMISFAHEFQHGTITMQQTGPSPHINFFFVLTKDGHLLYEKYVDTWNNPRNPMTDYWPAIGQHPMALYGDYPSRPASWVYKSLGYGVCFQKARAEEVHPCL